MSFIVSKIGATDIMMEMVVSKSNVDAVVPKINLSSRGAKRGFDQESKKVIWDLGWINSRFLVSLFSLPSYVDYNEIYTFHLEQWVENAKMWNKKLKFCHVDENWFCEVYKPTENI
jgi:hypothetical protein